MFRMLVSARTSRSLVVYMLMLAVTDDPDIYDGAHVSIQLVGRRLQEEKMLAIAKYVGEALHGTAKAL